MERANFSMLKKSHKKQNTEKVVNNKILIKLKFK
jgi:hypothetical protein